MDHLDHGRHDFTEKHWTRTWSRAWFWPYLSKEHDRVNRVAPGYDFLKIISGEAVESAARRRKTRKVWQPLNWALAQLRSYMSQSETWTFASNCLSMSGRPSPFAGMTGCETKAQSGKECNRLRDQIPAFVKIKDLIHYQHKLCESPYYSWQKSSGLICSHKVSSVFVDFRESESNKKWMLLNVG